MIHNQLLNRENSLFAEDMLNFSNQINDIIRTSSFLVVGGAGTIGQAVAREIFSRNPKRLDVVDINENNLVELVRDLRSTYGYIDGDFNTYALDSASLEFEKISQQGISYDYILNLSALKHVRSEKDIFTLHRLVQVNIINSLKLLELSENLESKKYFCVSTDKAANPVNMMGASKRIMEILISSNKSNIPVSMARFANVIFSDGSLVHGFESRFNKNQPLSAPYDIQRYFVTPKESGELCLMSSLFGENMDIFFPRLDENLDLLSFDTLARRYLEMKGYSPYECHSEDEARSRIKELKNIGKWPCYFSSSETTGEKPIEEFYSDSETPDLSKFKTIGVVNESDHDKSDLANTFLEGLKDIRKSETWEKKDLVHLFESTLPEFVHVEKNKYLDQKM